MGIDLHNRQEKIDQDKKIGPLRGEKGVICAHSSRELALIFDFISLRILHSVVRKEVMWNAYSTEFCSRRFEAPNGCGGTPKHLL